MNNCFYKKIFWGHNLRGKNLTKMLKAIELLSLPKGTTINEMAKALDIDVRSVYRLLDTMQDLGFPVWDEKIPFQKKKQWKIDQSYLLKLPNIKIPDFNLTYLEIIFLYMLKNQSYLFKNNYLETYINSAFYKITENVPALEQKLLKKIDSLFISKSVQTKVYKGKEEIIQSLIEAVIKKESCEIKYHSFYDEKIKIIKADPLHFFENNGGFYIIINKTGLEEIRILAVERIIEIQNTGKKFEYPQNIEPEKFLDSSFDIISDKKFKAEIWFSKKQAKYIKERNWSYFQKIKENEDGSIIISMEISGWQDLKKWILSYGPDAKVLKPQKMVEEIISDLKKIIKNYET